MIEDNNNNNQLQDGILGRVDEMQTPPQLEEQPTLENVVEDRVSELKTTPLMTEEENDKFWRVSSRTVANPETVDKISSLIEERDFKKIASVIDDGLEDLAKSSDAEYTKALLTRDIPTLLRRDLTDTIRNTVVDSTKGIPIVEPVSQGIYNAGINTIQFTAEVLNGIHERAGGDDFGMEVVDKIFEDIKVKDEDTEGATNKVLRALAQATTGYAMAGKLIPKLAKSKKLSSMIARGVVGDELAFDSHLERLSDIIENNTEYSFALTRALMTDENDSEIVGRTKNAIEGAIVGGVIGSFFKALKFGKGSKIVAEDDTGRIILNADDLEKPVASEVVTQEGKTVIKESIPRITKVRYKTAIEEQIEALPAAEREEFILQMRRFTGGGANLEKEAVRGISEAIVNNPRVTKELTQSFYKAVDALDTRDTSLMKKFISDADDLIPSNYKETLTKYITRVDSGTIPQSELDAFPKLFTTIDGVTTQQVAKRVQTAEQAINEFNTIMKTAVKNKPNMSSFEKSILTLTALRQASLLSSVSTPIYNIASNSLMSLWRPAEKIAGSLVPGSSLTIREGISQLQGVLGSIKQGLYNTKEYWKTGKSLYQGEAFKKGRPVERAQINAELYGIQNESLLGRFLNTVGQVTSLPGKMVTAPDQLFKTINYTGEIHGLAVRQATAEGLTGPQFLSRVDDLIKNPTQDMMEAANQVAHKFTFTDKLQGGIKAIEDFQNSVPLFGLVLPFMKTVTRITKFGLESFPLTGFIFRDFRNQFLKGGAARDELLGRMALGSAISYAALDMYSKGIITGAPPANRGEADALRRQGWQEYSIRVGGTYVPLDRLEPLSKPLQLAIGAYDVQRLLDSDDETTKEDLAAMSIATFTQAMLHNNWEEGLIELFDVISSDSETRFKDYITNFSASYTPNILRRTAKFTDSHEREALGLLEKVKKGIPFLRSSLPIKYDQLGRPIINEFEDIGYSIIPFNLSRIKNDQVLQEMIDERMNIAPPAKTQTFFGRNINMKDHPHKYNRWMELIGQIKLDRYGDKTLEEVLIAHLTPGTIENLIYTNLASGAMVEGRDKITRSARGNHFANIISEYREEAKRFLVDEDPAWREVIVQPATKGLINQGRYKQVGDIEGYREKMMNTMIDGVPLQEKVKMMDVNEARKLIKKINEKPKKGGGRRSRSQILRETRVTIPFNR